MAKSSGKSRKSVSKTVTKSAPSQSSKARKTRKISIQSLKNWNLGLAVLFAAQAVAIPVLAKASSAPVTTSYLAKDTLASSNGGTVLVAASRHLFDLNLAYLVAAFLVIAGLVHLLVATVFRPTYEQELKDRVNKARWIEYALSGSLMLVTVALLSGVYDLSSLLMLAGLNIALAMVAMLAETHKLFDWPGYVVGGVAGLLPWLVFGMYALGAHNYGGTNLPNFVYWIYLTVFVGLAVAAANFWLQAKQRGRWADYLYGERIFLVIGLLVKSLLAWQVFFGALRP